MSGARVPHHLRSRALTPLRITAGIVWPVSHPPIPRGAILVDDGGRVVGADRRDNLPVPAGAPTLDFPDAVLLPGFVNTHTHLELHGLRDAVPDDDFFAWIQHVRKLKEATAGAAVDRVAHEGLLEAFAHGQTAVADSGTTGAAVRALAALGGHGVCYHEVIAPEPAKSGEQLNEARAALRRLGAVAPPGVTVGLSPHAPYTVSPDLARGTADLARSVGVPLAMHLAESAAESAFVHDGAGPFAQLWRRRRIRLPEPARSPVAYAERLGLLGERLLAIHAVQIDSADLATLGECGVAVAACPRSNRRHGHGDPPLAAMRAAGLRVGLGTDSVASVPSLDLRAEARLAQELLGCPAVQAVELLTRDGARALGRDRDLGTLAPGRWADACVLMPSSLPEDPETLGAAILDAGTPVAATIVAGRVVWPRS